MAEPFQSPAPRLDAWYSQLSARYVDLVGDYAGKERFFIEGDSLLLQVFSAPELDFEVGFQVLHAVYLVEQILQNLFKRGCKFDIVFFHEHEGNCVPPTAQHAPRYLLVRKIVIRHLRANSTKINVLHFRSMENVMFSEYLESSSVLFAVCADGTTYSTVYSKTLSLKSHSSTESSKFNNKMQSSRLRGIIYDLIHRGLNVALLNGLNFQDSKVFAFILERSQNLPSPSILADRADLPAYSPTENGSPQTYDKDHIATIMAALGPASTRLKLTLATLKSIDGKVLPFLPAFLAHAHLLDSLPLTARRFATVEFDHKTESVVAGFIDSWSGQLCQNINSWIGREKPDTSLVDIFDGRMFRHILAHSVDSLPAAISANVSQLLRIATRDQLMHINDCANPIAASIKEPHGEGLYGRETRSRPTSIMPFSHPAFDKHLQEIHVVVKEAPSQRLHGNKISEELTHWHNAKKPLLIKRNAPVDPIEKAGLMKSNQRFMAEMQSYAASLTNASGKSLMLELILVGASNISVSKALAIRGGELGNSNPVKSKALQQKSSLQAGAKAKNEKFATESAKRAEAANAAALGSWKNAREALDAAKTPEERYVRTKRYFADVMDRKDASTITNDVELYKLSTLLMIWGNYCTQSKKTEGLYVAALIYDAVMELSRSTLPFP